MQLYTPLNVFIALVGVVVWSKENEIELSNDGDKTLKNFLNYRRKTLIKDHPNDNAQLLTHVQFDGGVVGMCDSISVNNNALNSTDKFFYVVCRKSTKGTHLHL